MPLEFLFSITDYTKVNFKHRTKHDWALQNGWHHQSLGSNDVIHPTGSRLAIKTTMYRTDCLCALHEQVGRFYKQAISWTPHKFSSNNTDTVYCWVLSEKTHHLNKHSWTFLAWIWIHFKILSCCHFWQKNFLMLSTYMAHDEMTLQTACYPCSIYNQPYTYWF